MRPLLWLVLVPAALAAAPVSYEISPAADSRFALEVAKTGLMSGKKHLFLFDRYRGTLVYDPDAPEATRVEMIIEAGSAVCQDTWVKPKDLQKIQETALKDMMAADRYPELRFVSNRVTRQPDGRFGVEGTLTVRGIDKPAMVTVALEQESGGRLRLAGEAEVRIRDYGLKPPSAVLGAVGTKNEMQVEFRVTAERK
jgi:polyisoprenoid-binding protein YceI